MSKQNGTLVKIKCSYGESFVMSIKDAATVMEIIQRSALVQDAHCDKIFVEQDTPYVNVTTISDQRFMSQDEYDTYKELKAQEKEKAE